MFNRCKHLGGLKVVLFRNNLRMCVDSLGFSHSIGKFFSAITSHLKNKFPYVIFVNKDGW